MDFEPSDQLIEQFRADLERISNLGACWFSMLLFTHQTLISDGHRGAELRFGAAGALFSSRSTHFLKNPIPKALCDSPLLRLDK